MKRFLTMLVTGSSILAFGFSTGFAQEEEAKSDPATPIEIYACKYNEGMGPADLDAASAKWTAWANKRELNSYSAWTLVPFYAGPEQDFDFLWLGGAESAAALGRAQEDWLANGSKIQEQFNAVSTCDGHSNFASVKFKTPPKREDPSRVVVSFSDCNISDGLTFSDVAPGLGAWAEYREGHGSTSGMWVLFPAYGQGGEKFDFKFIASWGNLEEQGVDWDQYSESGWQKAEELFTGKLDCDASRVYIATNRRMAADDGE